MIVDIRMTYRIRHSQVREYVIWEDIFHSRINADMIVLGSSRAYAHYNPAIFEVNNNVCFYNLGLNGKLADMDVFRYHQYKKHNNKKPKIVLWDVMYSMFGYSEGYGDEQFMGYIHNKDIWKEIHNRRHKITYFDRFIPLLRYWRKGMIHTFPNAVMNVYHGYRKEYTPFDNSELLNIKDHSIKPSLNKDVVLLFKKTIEEIQQDGSRVVLVYSPLYIQGQNKIDNFEKIIDTFQTISNEEHCLFLNYLNDSINYDSTLFKNASHLNYMGADIFSLMLAHDIDSIFHLTVQTVQ